MEEKNMIIKLNEILLDLEEVETIEWKEDDDDFERFSVRFHMKSGKMFTRLVHENQLKILSEQFKEEEE
jgi:hypothetical protein|tara:strand:+ start:5289 stop:5495 length:207 start_codon:yes stop_codon:yes gene_type:complete